jgi:GT2 family glycosyltransferase
MGMVDYYPAINRPAKPTCSVCVANYNGVALLESCLDSILGQSCEIAYEIIVHDDASSDDSVALLQSKYPQVSIICSEENVGFCVSNNRMVEYARGDHVLLLNNDAALYPDALTTLFGEANELRKAAILSLPQYDWESASLVDRGCLLDPFYNPVPNLDPLRTDVAMVIGACLYLPRTFWLEMGGFPEWIESIGEDMYLCCMARLRGASVTVAARSGYRHQQGSSFGGNRVVAGQLQTNFRRRRLSERNKTSVLFICTPTIAVWPLLAMHLGSLVAEGFSLSILKRDIRIWELIYLPALKHVFHSWHQLMGERRRAQSLRTAALKDYAAGFVPLPQKLRLLFRHGLPKVE